MAECFHSTKPASNHPKPQMRRHRLEISVVVQQGVAVFDAERADQQVDRLAHGHALAAQEAMVRCRPHGDAGVDKRDDIQPPQRLFHPGGFVVGPKPLENLAENKIADEQSLPSDKIS